MTTASFSEALRARHSETWNRAVSHRFVAELLDGSIDDDVMAGYLVQDYRFLDGFLALIRAAVASADTLQARLAFARFAGEIAGEENTYFLRSFEALGVSGDLRASTPDTRATAAFKALFREAAETRVYAAAVTVLMIAEWLYLDWAVTASDPRPSNFVHDEWITLHDFPEYHERVAFLRAEFDRVAPLQPEIAEDFFARAVQIELDFFDASYAEPLRGRR